MDELGSSHVDGVCRSYVVDNLVALRGGVRNFGLGPNHIFKRNSNHISSHVDGFFRSYIVDNLVALRGGVRNFGLGAE